MPDTKVYGLSVIRAPVEIEVQVKISQNGTVIDAFVPTSRDSGSRSPLAFPAIAAAKQWIFEPARMHGKNIPSDFSIRFAFRPNIQ
jgi:Gram-negative bacterial TonB protein C-terminal